MRQSWVEIDLHAVAHNVAEFRRHLGDTDLCAVVKADAYGHGDVPVAEVAVEGGATWLAVALLEEGIRLREAGIDVPILLLSEPLASDAPVAVEWDLTPTVYSVRFVDAWADAGGQNPIHCKLDTGMHRVGTDVRGMREVVDRARSRDVAIGAVWTHFAVAEVDPDFTALQRRRLADGVAELGLDGIPTHDANTAGAILRPGGSMARVGLGLYGLYPSPACRGPVDLRPAMRVVSHVSHVRRHPAGTRPSYGRRRPLVSDAWVATVPIGYADGVPRLLTDTGDVLLGGRRRPFAGTVTMDQLVIDCGDEKPEVGDEVVLIGRQGEDEITADEWADQTGTISYEIVCGIGPRMPRLFGG